MPIAEAIACDLRLELNIIISLICSPGFNQRFPSDLAGLEADIQAYLQRKYETPVQVSQSDADKQGNTSSWTISIVKEANRPDLPRQKIHIDVCAIPSFDCEKRPLINHYNVVVPTEGLLIPVQSLSETLADKFIALAYRARRIKPCDVWDIVWIAQRGSAYQPNLLIRNLLQGTRPERILCRRLKPRSTDCCK